MNEEPETSFTISGHKITLPDERSVWAGEHGNSWYIEFQNKDAVRKLRISYEAAEALMKILSCKPQEIYRYVLTIEGGKEMKWEAFEPDLVAALAVTSTDRLTATDDGPKPACNFCGKSVFGPCTSNAMAAGCVLPPADRDPAA